MNFGLISTIIPVYNRPAQLREAVNSVIEQEYRPIEVVIVDDGSTDDSTLTTARQLEVENNGVVRVLTQRNAGAGPARESGRMAATGEFIQYLDSDDILLPGKFAAQVAALRAEPEADVCYGKTRFRHADGRLAEGAWKGSGVARTAMFPSFLTERWWDTPNPLYRATICDRVGPWTDLRLEEDWEYDCRVAAVGGRLVWCDAFVCEVRDHVGARLSRWESTNASTWKARAASHLLVWEHAKRADLPRTAPESVKTFARTLFLLARQCGSAGLESEAAELARSAQLAGGGLLRQWDLMTFRVLAALVGWRLAGRFGAWFDAGRRRRL